MEKVVDMVTEYILPDVADILKGLPPKKKDKKDSKVRVATETGKTRRKTIKVGGVEAHVDVEHDGNDDDEEEEEQIKVPARHKAA